MLSPIFESSVGGITIQRFAQGLSPKHLCVQDGLAADASYWRVSRAAGVATIT